MSSAVINRLDYQEPAFRVENINLVFNLDPVTTTVYNTMRIEPLTDSDHDLVLNGSELELASVFENGSPLSTERYTVTPEALIIRGIRQKTTITIYNRFHPQANTLLSGIYMSNGNFMSQCESEGFRRITYFPITRHADPFHVEIRLTKSSIRSFSRTATSLNRAIWIMAALCHLGRSFAQTLLPLRACRRKAGEA